MAESSQARCLQGRMIPVETILDIIQCSVCWEVLKVPFKQCQTGHLMCNICIGKVAVCPLCQETRFTQNTNCIKKILAAVPHPCCYAANGCKMVVEPNENHEAFCMLRTVNCKLVGCWVPVPLGLLKKHYQTKHPSVIIFAPTDNIVWQDFYFEEDYRENLPIIVPEHHFGFATPEQFFWLQMICKENFLDVTFHMHPAIEPKVDYMVEIKLKDGTGSQGQTYNLKASKFNGKFDKSACSMKLHKSSVKWFGDKNKGFDFDYKIYTKPKSN